MAKITVTIEADALQETQIALLDRQATLIQKSKEYRESGNQVLKEINNRQLVRLHNAIMAVNKALRTLE